MRLRLKSELTKFGEQSRMKERARNDDASVEREFAKAFGWEVAKAGSKPYGIVARSLRALERSYVSRVRNKASARELRRRIAEQMLQQAILHDCSHAVCRSRLEPLSRLGFTNIERKGHCYLLYARGAFARGHRRVARTVAEAMAKELERSLKRRKSLLARDLLKSFRVFLRDAEMPRANG